MLTFDHTTLGQRVLFGRGMAIEHTVAAVQALDLRRVLLIADSFVAELADHLTRHVPVVALIDEIVQHVPTARARAAVSVAESHRADGVISIGGGSAVGLAKIVARDVGLPIIALPTTFAGSEATDVWGQTEGQHKRTGTDPAVLPKTVVYDVDLYASFPPDAAVASGLNAVAHAVDGFWAPRADPINTAIGTEALRALVQGLRATRATPDEVGARERTLYGAYLAGVAFTSAGGGLHHKICHLLGGRYNLPHAQTHSAVLAYVTQFNAPYAPAAGGRICEALGSATAAGGLSDLRAELGVTASLAELGMPESGIDDTAEQVVSATPPSNPRPVTPDDARAILRAAWAGAPIERSEGSS